MAGKPNQGKTLVPKMTQYNQKERETMVGLPGNELQSTGWSNTSTAAPQTHKIPIAKHGCTIQLDRDSKHEFTRVNNKIITPSYIYASVKKMSMVKLHWQAD